MMLKIFIMDHDKDQTRAALTLYLLYVIMFYVCAISHCDQLLQTRLLLGKRFGVG